MTKNIGIYIGEGSLSTKSSPHIYAQSCELYPIFSQISKIIARKNNLNPNQALGEYLNQCNKGEHVVLKSYSSFSKSSVNRQCFLYNFCKIFQMETNARNGLDYYQLFRLLCSDFPKQVVTNAVKIVQGQHQKMMETLVNSDKFLNALYISFIYFQYLENLLQKIFQGKHEQEASLLQLFEWIRVENSKSIHILQKPPIQILYQIILNYLNHKNAVKIRGISFLNQSTIGDFILNCVGENKNGITISYQKLVAYLLQNKSHQKLVNRNIFCFDNSANWAAQAAKLLNIKDSEHPQPLNSKKMKKK